MKGNNVKQFCGQRAVAAVANDKMKKEGDFNFIFLTGEKKGEKIGIGIIIELKIDICCTCNNYFLWKRRLNIRNWSQLIHVHVHVKLIFCIVFLNI